jgi:hypothetical protein
MKHLPIALALIGAAIAPSTVQQVFAQAQSAPNAPAMQQSAAAQDAKTFVDGIYKLYIGKEPRAIDYSSREQLDRYFTQSMADLIEHDYKTAEKESDAPVLGGDPFIDAQDWDISSYEIRVQETAKDRAAATVTFNNFGKPVVVRLALERTGKGWRVDDVLWQESSLREIYKTQ